MSRFINEKFRSLVEYVPGEQPKDGEYLKLNTNESPYPPGPKTRAALRDPDLTKKLRLYSDPDSGELCRKLAETYGKGRTAAAAGQRTAGRPQAGLGPENIYVGNGSDEILNFIFMKFCEGGVLFPEISYGFYEVFADLYGVDFVKVPLREDFSIDPDDYAGCGRTIVIANPNAPTGRILCLDEIETILKTNPKNLVVIDEAYIDFGGESAMGLIGGYDNLLVVCTYSKSRSMAGARLGFAMGAKAVIDDLVKIKYATNPYNVNALTAAAGLAALHEPGYYRENCRQIQETRRWTTEALTDLGFRVVPSATNFIFVTTDRIGGSELYQGLKQRKILIRHFDIPAIRQYNRITIGTRRQMELLVETIDRMLGDADDGAGPGIAASPDGEEQL